MRIVEWTFNGRPIVWDEYSPFIGGADITIIARAERDEYPNEWLYKIKLSAPTARVVRAISSGIKACVTALEADPDPPHC